MEPKIEKQAQQRYFVKLREAAQVTGLSQGYLRKRAKAGNIPCTRAGTVYYLNLPALLEQLDAESRPGGQA